MLKITTNLREFTLDEKLIKETNRGGVGINIFNLAKKTQKENEFILKVEEKE